jgi:circadian clock protein KaiB
MNHKNKDEAIEFESAIKETGKEKYILRLYIAGMTTKSLRAVDNIKKILEEHLKGRYELEVIDISQQPNLVKTEDLIAAPTLIKKLPLPVRRFIGDLSNKEKIIVGLNLAKK